VAYFLGQPVQASEKLSSGQFRLGNAIIINKPVVLMLQKYFLKYKKNLQCELFSIAQHRLKNPRLLVIFLNCNRFTKLFYHTL